MTDSADQADDFGACVAVLPGAHVLLHLQRVLAAGGVRDGAVPDGVAPGGLVDGRRLGRHLVHPEQVGGDISR